MAERLLLTGAGGFVGRALVAPLQALGFEVHPVAHRTQLDLLDTDAARRLLADLRPAVLVHAAWYVEHGRFWTAPENRDWLEASTALAAHFAEAGGRRFVGLGTCAEYADVAPGDGAPWPETRRIAPATPYGAAKAELAQRLFALAERRAGLSLGWARLFHLFGPGEASGRLVASVVAALRERREAECASGRPVRDFASTGYLGRALAALTASTVSGPVNLATGQARSIAELVAAVGAAMGRSDLIRLGRLPDRPGEAHYVVADVTRLRREVGFTETFDLDAELAALLRSSAPCPGDPRP